MKLRKIHQRLIFACVLISLGYCLSLFLTEEPLSTVLSSAHALPERRVKARPYRQPIISFSQPTMERLEDASPRKDIVDAVLQQTPQVAGRSVLVNYLVQLSPADKAELQTVLNVAEEARSQLLSDQLATLDAIEQGKQSLSRLIQPFDGDFNAATSRYLDNLDQRRDIKRDIAIHEEEIQGLKLETGPDRMQELAEARSALQSLQTSLDALQTEITVYEAGLTNELTRARLGAQYYSFCERLETYKASLATALDQDVIINKFDAIFAAMSSVQLEDL
jgi:hypothetical protein